MRSHLDTLVQLNVCLLNDGEKSTFSRVSRESIIDLTFASPDLARNAAWHISDLYTHSDHSAVITEIRRSSAIRRMHPARHVGYKIDTLDRQTLLSSTQGLTPIGDANSCAQEFADRIKLACESSISKAYRGGSRRTPMPWWNEGISKARAECCAAKRRLQRARGRPSFQSNLEAFRTKRKMLQHAIKQSKNQCF